MTLLAYAVMTSDAPDGIAAYFLKNAYAQGGGKNVVNVILVDFRGFDTFGEITVLGIVALTVFSLLRRFRPAPDSIGSPAQQRIQAAIEEARPDRNLGDTVSDYLLVPAVIMQWLFPVIIVFAVYIFLRGHDLPGGGFAAGVAMAAAFILQYLAAGTAWVEARLRVLPVRWMGLGLLTAVGTGAGSWVFGYPFLTSHSQYIDLPLIGAVPTATGSLFDLGVFLLVIGATVLMLVAIAHQSVRRLRASKTAAAAEQEAA
jgi:multicomponent K+:H+ antiporter subunit A